MLKRENKKLFLECFISYSSIISLNKIIKIKMEIEFSIVILNFCAKRIKEQIKD